MDVVICGKGKFYNEYKEKIHASYQVVAIVDRKAEPCESENKIYKTIDMVKQKFDFVIVMVLKAEVIFEVVEILLKQVDYKKIKLGIADYGSYSLCDAITVGKNGQLCIVIDEKSVETYNAMQFYDCMKEMLIAKIEKMNAVMKEQLIKNYENIMTVLWNGRQPLSHNHEIDIYLRFPKMGVFDWGEIAAFNLRAIYQFNKRYVLDLGCADGFYYRRFYSFVDNIRYIGIDLDWKNIEKARMLIDGRSEFIFGDFIKDFPKPDYCMGNYTNIICNSTMQMLNDEEIDILLNNIKETLSENGIFSGAASLKNEVGNWKYCINPFDSIEELKGLLYRFFENVFVYNDAGMPGRIMFMASEGRLPFMASEEV